MRSKKLRTGIGQPVFDIITIQKGLLNFYWIFQQCNQVLFGFLLLSLYHPFCFLQFVSSRSTDVDLLETGPRGLASSINESKFKYNVCNAEEIARTSNHSSSPGGRISPSARQTGLPKTTPVSQETFQVLLTQFSFFVFFK